MSRTFPRSKHANLSYERAYGTCAANQEMHIATQHNICAANQDTAEHSTTYVQPIRCDKIKQWRRDRPRSDALIIRAAPASIMEYRLKNCLPWSVSSMPPLGFQCVTHVNNVHYEHLNNANFALQNEQNKRQGNDYRPRTESRVLPT
jgi:hypothetical protein